MAFIPTWTFVDSVTFKRKRGSNEDYEFNLFTVNTDGTRAVLDCTSLNVRFQAMGPVPKLGNIEPASLSTVVSGLSASRSGNPSDGTRKYTPKTSAGSNETNLYGIYLVEAWIENGSVTEKIPKGFAYWKLEAGDDVG